MFLFPVIYINTVRKVHPISSFRTKYEARISNTRNTELFMRKLFICEWNAFPPPLSPSIQFYKAMSHPHSIWSRSKHWQSIILKTQKHQIIWARVGFPGLVRNCPDGDSLRNCLNASRMPTAGAILSLSNVKVCSYTGIQWKRQAMGIRKVGW